MSASTDYYCIDNNYSEEQILIRSATRDWVKKHVKPHIEEHFQKAETCGIERDMQQQSFKAREFPNEFDKRKIRENVSRGGMQRFLYLCAGPRRRRIVSSLN